MAYDCRLRLNRIQYANQNETFLSIAKQTAISRTHTRYVTFRLAGIYGTGQTSPYTHTHTDTLIWNEPNDRMKHNSLR